MKILLNGRELELRAIWIEENYKVKMIDQRLIPWKFQIYESRNYRETAYAIREMVIRGAPSIGVAGAFGVVQAANESVNEKDFLKSLNEKAKEIERTRPTAVNLKNVISHLLETANKSILEDGYNPRETVEILFEEANKIADREVEANKRIGEIGKKLIKDGYRILTHCNTGALAAVDIGTALAPIRFAHKEGKNIFVFVDETRPRLQGAYLTAWELKNEGIPHTIIVDNAAGFFMWKGEIDMVIVGADRIALNGDVANKIGTYKLALAAHDNGIPFYVAAPLTTFDNHLKTGKEIPIEERSEEEVLYVKGLNEEGEVVKVKISPEGSRARNPAFDVTPSKYITGIITEVGLLTNSSDILNALKNFKIGNI